MKSHKVNALKKGKVFKETEYIYIVIDEKK